MSGTNYHFEDLGHIAYGDDYRHWRTVRHPRSGAEMAVGALSRSGFVVVDPAARTVQHIRAPHPLGVAWAIAQAPNGDIYQADGAELFRWDWQGDELQKVADLGRVIQFTLDVAPDGRIYLPDYASNRMFRYDPARGTIEDLGSYAAFGQHIRNVYCSPDGLVYVESRTYGGELVESATFVALDPHTLEKQEVEGLYGHLTWAHFGRDAQGRIFALLGENGREARYEILHGRVQPITLPAPPAIAGATLFFADGGYLKTHRGTLDLTLGDAQGREHALPLPIEGSPLELFTLAAGGGKIWVGTILPLTLWSYDPASGLSASWGNPTVSNGEIYTMAFANQKLFMAIYPEADVRRLDPALPPASAARSLGNITCGGRNLHRPHGCTNDGGRHIFFAAHGGYGNEGSGLARVDVTSEEMVSWDYPATTFFALAHCKATGELLVSEVRKGEARSRFTFISPQDGRILWSEPVLPGGSGIVSWLDSSGDWIYGLHANTATLFAFSLSQKRIVAEQREMRFGAHLHNALVEGRDGRIWGVTNEGVFAATHDLEQVELLASLGKKGGEAFYRFGTVFDKAGRFYMVCGNRLMRMTATT